MEFPSQADYELLIYTLPQNHPDVISSSLHLYTTSRGTVVIQFHCAQPSHVDR